MTFINKETGLELAISKSLLDEIGKYVLGHYPNEFGGFLLGKYSEDYKRVFIEGIILPEKYKGTPTGFYRSPLGIENEFRKAYSKNKLHYVGEWHSHPNGSSEYSEDDLNAMKDIVKEETVLVKNPILLILSVIEKKINDIQFYIYMKNRLKKYE